MFAPRIAKPQQHAPTPESTPSWRRPPPRPPRRRTAWGPIEQPPPGRTARSAVPPIQRACASCDSEAERRIAPKLAIGSSSDPLEPEADRVADEITRSPQPAPLAALPIPAAPQVAPAVVQRQCTECEEDESTLVQREEAPGAASAPNEAPALVQSVLSGGGAPLDAATRADFEPRLGVDLGAVRIHTGSEAARLSQELNANAFTHGKDVFFASGKFDPATVRGRRLLAHELTHTIQQSSTTAGRILREPADHSDDGADQAARAWADMDAELARIDMNTIADANARALDMLTNAWLRLTTLRGVLRGGASVTDPDLVRARDAIQHWLRVELATGPARFMETLDKAIDRIERNLTTGMKPRRRGPTSPKCTFHPGVLASTDLPVTDNVVNFCDPFFQEGPQCQRNIVVHERFHLLGFHHGENLAGHVPRQEAMRTDLALDSADHMLDLIKAVTGFPVHACGRGL